MRYLEQELQYMNENLVKENFNRYQATLDVELINMEIVSFCCWLIQWQSEIWCEHPQKGFWTRHYQ